MLAKTRDSGKFHENFSSVHVICTNDFVVSVKTLCAYFLFPLLLNKINILTSPLYGDSLNKLLLPTAGAHHHRRVGCGQHLVNKVLELFTLLDHNLAFGWKQKIIHIAYKFYIKKLNIIFCSVCIQSLWAKLAGTFWTRICGLVINHTATALTDDS